MRACVCIYIYIYIHIYVYIYYMHAEVMGESYFSAKLPIFDRASLSLLSLQCEMYTLLHLHPK